MIRLVVSPHLDDSELGCFSCLDINSVVAVVSINEERLKYQNRPSYEERLEEGYNVKGFTGHRLDILSHFPVCSYEVRDCIEIIEQKINEVKPDEVYIPTPVSYNQDHKVVYGACMVALRPHDENWFVPKVFVYEQPHTFLWSDEQFQPCYFRKLDLDRKLETYHLYKTQVRSFRSDKTITSLAKLRGEQSGFEYAESFDLLREVVK